MTTMMRAGLDLLATLAPVEVMRFGVVLALKASILLAVSATVTVVLARRTAALRHFVWSLALGGALALPFVARTLPWSWQVLPARPVATAAEQRASGDAGIGLVVQAPRAARRPAGEAGPVPAPGIGRVAATAAPVAPSTPAAPRSLPVGWIALALWAVVADVLLLHMVAGRLSLALMARRATPVLDETFLEELVRGTRAAGVRRPVRLLWSHRARVPMTWGIRRPVVLLPEDARSWSRERIGLVLQHELAHVRRVDDLTHMLARVACAVHWFNPLVWWAASRLRDESELACDDQVLRTGARASEYARHLLELVSTLGVHAAPAGALPLAQRSRFEGRLLAILDPARRRSGLERGGATALVTFAAGLVVLLGAVAPERAEAAPEAIAQVFQAAETPKGATPSAPTWKAVEVTVADSASVRALMRALTQDDDEGVRRAAAWALGQLEDRTATGALATALTADASIEVRRTVAWALGQIEDPSSVSALGRALSDADAEVRHTALWALGQIESPEAIPELTRALGDPEADVRKTAAWALGQIESRDAVAPVSRALSDESPRVRKQAAWALGQIEADEALPALSSALSDTNPEVAATAAWAIGQIEPSSAPPALLEAVRSGGGELRSNALWALAQIQDPAAVPVLTEVLRDQNPDVRATALRGLASIRDESAIRAITGLLEDPDPEVRAAAVRALAGRGGGWGGSPRPRPQPRPRPRPRPNG